MSIAHRTQGFVFYIATPETLITKPIKQQVLNNFDFIGDRFGELRLKDETNIEYKQRLLDIKVHPGSSLYDGIINNITRAFGYRRKKCMTVSLNTDISGNPLAESPRVDFLANKVILYNNWQPNKYEEIDMEIRIYNENDVGFYISDLVDQINTSTYFSAVLENDVRPNTNSGTLVRDTSVRFIRNEVATDSKRISLSGNLITKNSLSFDETNIFNTEVLTTPSANGEYLVNYINGTIESFSIPSGIREISYYYAKFPLEIDYSPIQLYTLQDDYFINELFEKELLASGEEVNSLPTTEGTQIFNQLYSDIKIFWGN